jgi:hypothetical protein
MPRWWYALLGPSNSAFTVRWQASHCDPITSRNKIGDASATGQGSTRHLPRILVRKASLTWGLLAIPLVSLSPFFDHSIKT